MTNIHIPIPLPVQPPRKPLAPPTPAEILANRASSLYYAGRTADALPVAMQAVETERTPHTLNNLVVILETLGRPDEAFPYAHAAYLLEPDDPRMARLYGESLLRQGDLARGWPIYARTHEPHWWLSPHVPEWRGESLADRRILVFAVDGYGDNIYFSRWLLDLADLGASVYYLAPPHLVPLARTLSPDITVVPNYNGNFDLDLGMFDFHVDLHGIPQYLGVTYGGTPSRVPYFHVAPRPRFHLRRRTGFCWKAGEGRTSEGTSPWRTRSLNWDQRQRVLSKFPPSYIDLSSLTGSWLDTAQLIRSLDLLVTVDTGLAHLGGALGVPTWVMIPGASAWHYPAHLDRHPFYPSMRMFFNRGEGLNRAVSALVAAL